jgi:hypothetical protein
MVLAISISKCALWGEMFVRWRVHADAQPPPSGTSDPAGVEIGRGT